MRPSKTRERTVCPCNRFHRAVQILEQSSIVPSDTGRREEATTPQVDKPLSVDGKQTRPKNFERDSTVASRSAAQLQTDERWPDLFDYELEEPFELLLQEGGKSFRKLSSNIIEFAISSATFQKIRRSISQRRSFGRADTSRRSRNCCEARLPEELGYIVLIESTFSAGCFSFRSGWDCAVRAVDGAEVRLAD